MDRSAPADDSANAPTSAPIAIEPITRADQTAEPAATTAHITAAEFAPAFAVPSTAEVFQRAVRLDGSLVQHVVAWSAGEVVDLPLPDGRTLRGRVNLAQTEASGQRLVGGELVDGVGGTFSLGVSEGKLGGVIFPSAGVLAYTIEYARNGVPHLLEKLKTSVVCLEFPKAEAGAKVSGPKQDDDRVASESDSTGETFAVAAAGAPEFSLSSRPGSIAVAYLDFDGEAVTDSLWNGGNPIDATHSGLNATQITEVWRRVAEDFRAFDVDVTTDRARYDATPAKYRMRCIVTQNSGWYGSAGGVAYLSSWRQAGSGSFSSTIPCWVFANLLLTNPRYIAEACSHEIGHTLGLSHDGLRDSAGSTVTTYYGGHGSGATGWAPIMGVGYYQALVQWSKGEYGTGGNFANNTEDDLAIITSAANHVAYVADHAAGTVGESAALRFSDPSTVNTIGTLARSGDTDAYRFTTGGGLVSLSFVPEFAGEEGWCMPNLDVRATLHDLAGNVLAESNPIGGLFPSLNVGVPSGTYVLSLQSVGEGDGASGYSNYGSLGRYQVTGTIPSSAGMVPSIGGVGAVAVIAGQALNYQIEATAGVFSYGASGLPAGLSVNPSTGVISGVATGTGPHAVTLSATNAAGTGTRVVEFNITVPIAVAVDAPSLPWTFGGNANWYEDSASPYVGASAARSGAIANNKESWLETSLTGPGVLTFWWKVSSQSGGDFLRVRLDGVEQAAISGSVAWAQRTIPIPAGVHAVRWTYAKNGSGTSGSDAGWIDGVNYAKAVSTPVITSAGAARSVIGMPFSFVVTASNSPASFAATNLPAGLSIHPVTGLISGTVPTGTAGGLRAVTVSATNSGGTGTATFNLDVRTGFSAWAQDAALSGGTGDAMADPDGDNVNNWLEYAFARSALAAETPVLGLPQTMLIEDHGTPRLEVVFTLPENRPDLVYTVQVSDDLVNWVSGHAYGAGVVNGASLPTVEVSHTGVAGGQEIVVRDIDPGASQHRFIRVVVSAQ